MRPTTFDDIQGQDDVVERLRIMSTGCKNSGQVMPHVLIDGPPGLGKTTISSAIANEIGTNMYTVNAASVRASKNLMPYLMNLELGSILFIDEIHRLPKLVEEFLYPVMEDFKIDMLVENQPDSIDIPQFTMVGATTSGGSLSQPFYDRFTIKEHLSFYDVDVLAKLAGSNADRLGLKLSDEEMLSIAKRSKGTPRILNARLQWYKNYTSYYPEVDDIDKIFTSQGIDKNGFDANDVAYLNVLKKNRCNPLGLKSLSGMTGIAMETIENSIEPYMVRMGYVTRTKRGRILGSTQGI
jgi:Holliday junction DNA helicase RuvB|tara:strand:+ start:1544 stop:2431 length:888 start_codon:yes stop_codon:yes gene_type:complete